MKTYIRVLFGLSLCASLFGCSSKISRREATHQIDEMLEPHAVGAGTVKVSGSVPGFHLSDDDAEPGSDYFTLDQHKEYGGLTSQVHEPRSPDSEEYLVDALQKMGFVSVQEEGPKSKYVGSIRLDYPKSHSISLTAKAGSRTQDANNVLYSTGFECYPPPDFHQCNIPHLLERGQGFRITGIVQDETHAKVNILIPWKLTPFGIQLKPYAASVAENEKQFGYDSSYDRYPVLYSWAHFLNSHQLSGESPAVILFQKFDDGWRLVDENGQSQKDFK